MNAIYGYVVAALLVVAIVAGGVGYAVGSKHAHAAAKLVMMENFAEALQAEADHKDRVRELEQNLATAQADASEAYEKGKRNAEATGAAVAADLRAGNLRLQRRWTGCETQLSNIASSAGEFDAAARDREESAGRIVRAAAQCDAQVHGLQEILILEREQLNKQQDSSRR